MRMLTHVVRHVARRLAACDPYQDDPAAADDGGDDSDDDDDAGEIAYLQLYCDGAPRLPWLVLWLAWILLLVSLLASTADRHFVPQLETMSERLGLKVRALSVVSRTRFVPCRAALPSVQHVTRLISL